MGERWAFLLLLAVAATTVRSLEFNITTTWNGTEFDHSPIQLELSGTPDGDYLELSITAPFFNDPPAPPGPPGQPFYGLWDYEVVEAFFLNDDDQYVEIEVCPWGQHIVLLLNGQRVTIRHSLPLEVTTTMSGDLWTGLARIPVGYLPQNVTKFNAYAIHGSGEERQYESLYPASENATAPDFHALQYFNDIDLSEILPEQETADMSELWEDALKGILRYRIQTEWNSTLLDHAPAEISLQGWTAGVEMNITAPFFNDTAPDGEAGTPFYGLWDYEVVEMFFLNDNDEYLEVELGPWGEHLLLLLKGARNVLKHSIPLDYVIIERTEPSGETPGQWKGSAMIPPGYFPPNVTRINAYAIHGTGDDRQYESLYPAPSDDPEYPVPDFHRLELFRPIDFEFLVNNNSYYSKLWQDAIASSSTRHTSVFEAAEAVEAVTEEVEAVTEEVEAVTEEVEAMTVLGPHEEFQATATPVQPTLLPLTPEEVVQADEDAALTRKPKPQRVLPDEQLVIKPEDEVSLFKPQTSALNAVPSPQPVRIGNREIENPLPVNQRRRPLRQPQRTTLEFQGNSQFQDQRPQFHNPPHRQVSPAFQGQGRPQETLQFQNQAREELQFQNQRRPQFQNQGEPQFQNQGEPPLQNQRPPQFQSQGRPQFQNQREPQFQNQRPPQFQSQGEPQFQSQGEPQFQNQRPPQFQSQGEPQFQNQRPPQFQSQGEPQFQNQGEPQFQSQGEPQFQSQGEPQFQNQRPPQFQNQEQPQRPPQLQNEVPPRFQEHGRPPIRQEQQSFDIPGSETSNTNPSLDTGVHSNVTPDVERAVITLAEETPALPPPHPVCFELGLVPDPDRCYVFHECVLEAGEWQMYSWRCRRGQVFDPVNVACVRGRCAGSQARRRRIRHP